MLPWEDNTKYLDTRLDQVGSLMPVEVEYRRYKNAGHGFGLGVGTDAEGWVGYAIEFWRNHASKDTPLPSH
jgi:hypothetical protein